MKTKLEIVSPGKIEFAMTITMTLDDWNKFRQQLTGNWPSAELNRQIQEMVIQANARFYPKEES